MPVTRFPCSKATANKTFSPAFFREICLALQLSREAGVEAASVTINSGPDSGRRLRSEVELDIDDERAGYRKVDALRDDPVLSGRLNSGAVLVTLTLFARPRRTRGANPYKS